MIFVFFESECGFSCPFNEEMLICTMRIIAKLKQSYIIPNIEHDFHILGSIANLKVKSLRVSICIDVILKQ